VNPDGNILGRLGAVAIGRNEGERLVRCLRSLGSLMPRVVYVDSGSTDASVSEARAAGATVVTLDMSTTFSAARARNAGLEELLQRFPDTRYVQFIDGDCELKSGWLDAAVEFLESNDRFAIAAGRRRERSPDATIYNRLCELEWNTPVGEASACGGDIVARVSAIREVGGYDPELLSGEEPEMCVRLRRAGWRIMRLDLDSTTHDAAIGAFSQWWKRTVRTGHGYAQGAALHGASTDRLYVGSCLSALLWAIALPALLLAASIALWPWGCLAWLVLPAQWARISVRSRSRAGSWRSAGLYALFIILGKFAEARGILSFASSLAAGRGFRPIEYKRPVTQTSDASP
jgi:GT2 family glycosyltransferase